MKDVDTIGGHCAIGQIKELCAGARGLYGSQVASHRHEHI